MMKTNPKVTLIVGIIILVVGISIFFLGMHAFDIAVNLMNVQDILDDLNASITVYETNLLGQRIELDDVYRRGIGEVLLGFYTTLTGSFIVGYVLRGLKWDN